MDEIARRILRPVTATEPRPEPNPHEPVSLERDCEAILIPAGTPITLPAGSVVFITQALGGSITVNVNGNLARIDGRNADALGWQVESRQGEETAPGDGSVDENQIWEELRNCYDPEIPINIVELGLIYGVHVTPTEDGNRVDVQMTLTAPGCGMGTILVEDIRYRIGQIANVSEVQVDLVFDPPWNPSMMSEAARLQTGMY